MGASPRFKVYTDKGEYVAALHYTDHAAMLVAGIGKDGTTIRKGHSKRNTLWTEGQDGYAAESYDAVVIHCHERLKEIGSGY